MRIFKGILITIGVIIALLLIAGIFIPKDFTSTQSITINKQKDSVFNYVKYLKNQPNYSKWAKMDPNMQMTFTGTDGQPGFISAWKSDKDDVGAGEQEIKSVKEGERVTYELRFKEPFESTASSYISTADAGNNQSKVDWSVSGRMNYPMNVFRLFMNIEESMGKDLKEGLSNLKVLLEK